MKMLCIKGAAPNRWHNGLTSGETYDVDYWSCAFCGKQPRALTPGSAFKKGTLLVVCESCGNKNKLALVPWGRDRFIPFNPLGLGVDIKEVNKLYKPSNTNRKEKVKS